MPKAGIHKSTFKLLMIIICIIEQAASNKLSLLLKIKMQKTQTLQLFKKIIQTESIYKSYWNVNQKSWVQRPSGLIKKGEEARAL